MFTNYGTINRKPWIVLKFFNVLKDNISVFLTPYRMASSGFDSLVLVTCSTDICKYVRYTCFAS